MTKLQSFYRNESDVVSAETFASVMDSLGQPAPVVSAEKTATAERRLALMGYLEALEGNAPAQVAKAKAQFADDYCVPADQFKVALRNASQHLI